MTWYGLNFELPINTSNITREGLGQSTKCPYINPPWFGNIVTRTNEVVA